MHTTNTRSVLYIKAGVISNGRCMVHTLASAASAWFIYFGRKPLWLSGDIISSRLFLLKHRDTVMLKDANNMHNSYIRRATTASIINYQLPRRSVRSVETAHQSHRPHQPVCGDHNNTPAVLPSRTGCLCEPYSSD